ncbi:MAG: hypothetical protein GXP40_04730 [Chloroflexi bacterium]|nr:hypothetical protein [Chloroflexota bacterium]
MTGNLWLLAGRVGLFLQDGDVFPPLVTLGSSVLFLQETLTLKHLPGVGLALGTIVLLSS